MRRILTKKAIGTLVASLGRHLGRDKCDRTLRLTDRACRDAGIDWNVLQAALEDLNAYCDCEALAKLKDHASCYRHAWKSARQRFPRAADASRVGTYPAEVHAGGGYVWDAVLEYRVWCCPEAGAEDLADGDDYYYAFKTYPEALRFSKAIPGADEPIALVLQKEYLDEPKPGKYLHKKKKRLTEWPVAFLSRPRRNEHTIPDFLSPNAPANRLDILRGLAKRKR